MQQRADLDLPAIDPGATTLARAALLVAGVGDGIGLHAGEEMVVLGEQAGDDLVRGIVGVGDEVEGLFDGGDSEESEHLVEQGAAVAIGPDHALVDARGERHGEHAGGGLNQQAHSLQRVSHDVFWLGVCVGLLMQELDRRHLAAALGDLDAVADQDVPAVDAQLLGEQAQHQLGPQRCEPVELDGGAVEVIDERIVAARIEVQRTHDGGDAEQLRSHREACHGGGEPQEGSQAGERRAQHPDRVPPEHPQRHRANSLLFLLNDVVTLERAVTMLNLS